MAGRLRQSKHLVQTAQRILLKRADGPLPQSIALIGNFSDQRHAQHPFGPSHICWRAFSASPLPQGSSLVDTDDAISGGAGTSSAATLDLGGDISEGADFSDAASASLPGVSLNAISEAASAGEAQALSEALEDTWFINSGFQQLQVFAHGSTGLPWWAVISCTTVAARLVMLPLSLAQVRNTHKLSQARPAMEQLQEWFQTEKARGNVRNAGQMYQMRLAEVWKQYDCHPFKSIQAMLFQFPVIVGFFASLRSLAEAKVPSLTHEGLLWFSDLTVADPYYVLPVLSSLILWVSAEVGAADGMQGQPPETVAKMKWGLRGVAVIMVPLLANFPAGVFVYFIVNNTFSFLWALVLKIPAVRKLAKLPERSGPPAHAAPAGIPRLGKAMQTYSARPPARKDKIDR